jgi:hypothetical protein
MNAEKLKETRMKIATNLLQGLAAYGGDTNVEWAYKVADEVLKQGGYDEAKTKNEELRKLEQRVAESEFKARLARGNKDSLHVGIVGTKELDYSSLSQGEQQRIVEIRKTYGIRDEE